MIEFKPITIEFKTTYARFLADNIERGCETSFTNLNIWGTQKYAILHDHLVIFSLYNGHYFYSFPIGSGDKSAAIDSIIDDAKERSIPCCITGLYGDAKETLEKLYFDRFVIKSDRNSYDYVYDIDDLADLQGRKYHKKRTHINKFRNAFNAYTIDTINTENLPQLKKMLERWYHDRLADNPENDYSSEQTALFKALEHYEELNMDGLVLSNNHDILAFTLGSQLSDNTFDIHFEKAKWDVNGAYTVIANEFAKYIRNNYPHIRFLNREEDMGLEGLRKSKESYYPHHMIEKSRALLQEV